ncbi:unnamed protein product, partial [Prorocentrum cordatum]
EFVETFEWALKGSAAPVALCFRGVSVQPSFEFDVERLSFGTVSYGFLNSRMLMLTNTSEVPCIYTLRIPGDENNEFDIIPSNGTLLPGCRQRVQVDFVSSTEKKYDLRLAVDLAAPGAMDSSTPSARCRGRGAALLLLGAAAAAAWASASAGPGTDAFLTRRDRARRLCFLASERRCRRLLQPRHPWRAFREACRRGALPQRPWPPRSCSATSPCAAPACRRAGGRGRGPQRPPPVVQEGRPRSPAGARARPGHQGGHHRLHLRQAAGLTTTTTTTTRMTMTTRTAMTRTGGPGEEAHLLSCPAGCSRGKISGCLCGFGRSHAHPPSQTQS